MRRFFDQLKKNLKPSSPKKFFVCLPNFLIENSAKKIRSKNIKVKKIICEAPSKRVLNFYLKNNFKIIGKKLRLFHNFYILQKRI